MNPEQTFRLMAGCVAFHRSADERASQPSAPLFSPALYALLAATRSFALMAGLWWANTAREPVTDEISRFAVLGSTLYPA